MTIEAATYANDLNVSNPASGDPRSEGDDHIRLLKSVLKNTFPYLGGVFHKVNSGLSGAQSPTFSSQNTQIFAFTGNGTLNLPAVASAGNGWTCAVYAPNGVTVTVDPNGAETINGSGTLAVTNAMVLIVNTGSAWMALVGSAGDSRMLGEVVAYAGTSVPSGWLWCDGSAVSRSTYASLFAAIGTSFGVGDGSTTFNLPDLRGRLPVGKDDMDNSVGTGGGTASRVTSGGSGVNGASLGASGGAETVTLAIGQIPSHDHGGSVAVTGTAASAGAHTHNVPYSGINNSLDAVARNSENPSSGNIPTSSDGAHTHSVTGSGTISAQGGGGAHNNMPPVQVVNYIIKAF